MSMPTKLLSSYIDMMPVLEAQESLLEYARTMLGSGSYGKKGTAQAKSTFHGWVNMANTYATRRKADGPKTEKEMAAMVGMMGIPFVKVKRKNGGK